MLKETLSVVLALALSLESQAHVGLFFQQSVATLNVPIRNARGATQNGVMFLSRNSVCGGSNDAAVPFGRNGVGNVAAGTTLDLVVNFGTGTTPGAHAATGNTWRAALVCGTTAADLTQSNMDRATDIAGVSVPCNTGLRTGGYVVSVTVPANTAVGQLCSISVHDQVNNWGGCVDFQIARPVTTTTAPTAVPTTTAAPTRAPTTPPLPGPNPTAPPTRPAFSGRVFGQAALTCLDSINNYPGPTEIANPGASTIVPAKSAFDNSRDTYLFYQTIFNRNSYDNRNAQLVSTVNTAYRQTAGGQCQTNNAFWSSGLRQMVYLPDSGGIFNNIAGGLDVVSHELTHAVTSVTSRLVYQGDSGALNEAMSDIFGIGAEAWVASGRPATAAGIRSAGARTYALGDTVVGPRLGTTALRFMNNPTLDRSSRDSFATRFTGTADGGGVHTNSGIFNLMFFLLAEGGSHPRLGGPAVRGVGMGKALQIAYRTNTGGLLTPRSTFDQSRTAFAAAARQLFGTNSAEFQSVHQAFDAVGVPGTSFANGISAIGAPLPASSSDSGSSAAIIGGVVGAGSAVVVASAFIIVRRRKQSQKMATGNGKSEAPTSHNSGAPVGGVEVVASMYASQPASDKGMITTNPLSAAPKAGNYSSHHSSHGGAAGHHSSHGGHHSSHGGHHSSHGGGHSSHGSSHGHHSRHGPTQV